MPKGTLYFFYFKKSCILSALNNVEDADECIEYEKVGCFWDFLVKPRPLPLLVEDYRSTFDWNDPRETIKR